MLRRLIPRYSYRSLTNGFWPQDLPLGGRTIVYGHNGSGKSSLASLLLGVASDACPVDTIWEDESGRSFNVATGKGGPSPAMAVFTKEWVDRNLAQFLEGATAAPIVTLGEAAIEAKEQEGKLSRQVEDFRAKAADSTKRQRDQSAKASKLARSAQDAIAEQLREFDFQRFSKNRYSLPVVEGKIRDHRGDYPTESQHAEALKRLGEGAAQHVESISEPPSTIQPPTTTELDSVVTQTPNRVALESLTADHSRQSWAERGLELHAERHDCLFCGGTLTDERREQLSKHFDRSWFEIREEARSALGRVRTARTALSDWVEAIPAPSHLSSELRDGYAAHLESCRGIAAKRMEVLAELETALQQKVDDPSVTPDLPDTSALYADFTIAPLQLAVAEQNKQADEHAGIMERRLETVLEHLIGSRSEAYRRFELAAQTADAEAKAMTEAADLAQRSLLALRQRQYSNTRMAKTLTRDLARVYGKHHLSVVVTTDGKSYACMRGKAPATHLSDGERTTLSLLYFLRSLEDQTASGDRGSRVVVIDDPSSSLDREALFATHQWLVDTLKDYGQYIVFTHDFGLLRLFLKSQANAWGKSRKKIRGGDADEARFPSVSFLEMFADTSGGARKTSMCPLPPMLVKNTTEYAYLFAQVMEGIKAGPDYDRLFLLPNAVRRVLEVFTSYKAPNLGTLDQRLQDLMGSSPEGNPYRDVYDFCNRYSHGEGGESVDVLDARVVHGQIRRCMEFFRFADSEHFERMCKATDTDSALLA